VAKDKVKMKRKPGTTRPYATEDVADAVLKAKPNPLRGVEKDPQEISDMVDIPFADEKKANNRRVFAKWAKTSNTEKIGKGKK
jgi:hypothetical protein